ncbi:DedA family protein [bacterium]|nr:DedA family protein [bacterium]
MERLLNYLTNLSSNIAYLIIFGILFACGLGLPLPEDIPLIATGYLIWDGTMKWAPALAVTVLGVLVGDTVLFFMGRKIGKRILRQHKLQGIFPPARVRRAGAYFRKYGDKLVFFARFVAGFRAVVFFMAGAMKVRYSRFLLFDALAALLSVPAWVGLGYALGHFFGNEISEILKRVKNVKNAITLIIVLVAVGIGVRWYRRHKARSNPNHPRHKKKKPV